MNSDEIFTELVKELTKYTSDTTVPSLEKTDVLKFMLVSSRDPKTVCRLVDLGRFYTEKHYIHDGCPNATGEAYQCEDCYSGDTEFEQGADISRVMVKIFKTVNSPNLILDDSDGESSSE